MRVLHVNTSERAGGAAIAASRLKDALNHKGVEAVLLVRDRSTKSPTTIAIPQRLRLRWAFLQERLRIWIANGFSRKNLWAVDIANAGTDITALPVFREADIVHLHWVNQGLLSMNQIAKIMRSGKPVVLTMHDMWWCTGICHHACECVRFHAHCHNCPLLQHPGNHDLSYQLFAQKQATYAHADITFVGVSRWMTAQARRSALAKGHTVVTIPNIIPLRGFQPVERQTARTKFGLPTQAAVIAFGAARIDQPAKGLETLMTAVTHCKRQGIHLLLFGCLKDQTWLQRIPCPYTYVGSVDTPRALSDFYSAADIVVNASEYETFGLTLAEAMACGCVPVSFNRGGQTDIITHLKNGYLAQYGDIDDLAAGIDWALDADIPAESLRQHIATHFSEDAVAEQYIQLYQSLLKQHLQ